MGVILYRRQFREIRSGRSPLEGLAEEVLFNALAAVDLVTSLGDWDVIYKTVELVQALDIGRVDTAVLFADLDLIW